MAYLKKISTLGKLIYPSLMWNFSREEKAIYLTFDDGPHPEITPWVLKLLKEYNAKATFFCVGENIEKYPETFKQILAEGHSVGNHTYNHLNGWKTSTSAYLENIDKAESAIIKYALVKIKNKLFRPPYGKPRLSQLKKLKKLNYQVVMWEVLSGDFDQKINSEECYSNVIENSKNGSIIVFHDSEKAINHLRYTLPKVLEYYKSKGYAFRKI